jgi:hypothetical protein
MLPAQVQYWNVVETKRHNLATEEQSRNELHEVHRHNVVTEGQASENIRLGWANLAETHRHNVAYEGETHRHNFAVESENIRHNQRGEQLTFMSTSEAIRHNLSNESIDRQRNNIQQQYNQGNLEIGRGNLAVAQANANTNRIEAMTHQYAQTTQANAAWNNSVTNKNRLALDENLRPIEVKTDIYRAETERTLGYYNALANMGRATSGMIDSVTSY